MINRCAPEFRCEISLSQLADLPGGSENTDTMLSHPLDGGKKCRLDGESIFLEGRMVGL